MSLVTKWSETEIEAVREMCGQRLTCTQIANELLRRFGSLRTRNAVIGLVHRQGFTLAGARGPQSVPRVSHGAKRRAELRLIVNSPRRQGGKRTVSTGRIAAMQPAPDVEPTQEGWPKPMTVTAVRFLDAAFNHCRMVLAGDVPIHRRMVCGAPVVPGKSWCPACLALVTGRGSPSEREAETILKRHAAR